MQSTEPLWRYDADWQLSFCCSSLVKTLRCCKLFIFFLLLFQAEGLFCDYDPLCGTLEAVIKRVILYQLSSNDWICGEFFVHTHIHHTPQKLLWIKEDACVFLPNRWNLKCVFTPVRFTLLSCGCLIIMNNVLCYPHCVIHSYLWNSCCYKRRWDAHFRFLLLTY